MKTVNAFFIFSVLVFFFHSTVNLVNGSMVLNHGYIRRDPYICPDTKDLECPSYSSSFCLRWCRMYADSLLDKYKVKEHIEDRSPKNY